jgi:hypothetical protein
MALEFEYYPEMMVDDGWLMVKVQNLWSDWDYLWSDGFIMPPGTKM